MENVTKALIIAGTILLLILLLSFMSYVFRNIGEDTSNLYSMIEESDIEEYNQIFLNYEGKDNLTIQDVVSIINLAQNNKEINGNIIKIIIEITWADSSKSTTQITNSGVERI